MEEIKAFGYGYTAIVVVVIAFILVAGYRMWKNRR